MTEISEHDQKIDNNDYLRKLRMAMLLLLGLLGGANSALLINSINTLLTYLQGKSKSVKCWHITLVSYSEKKT